MIGRAFILFEMSCPGNIIQMSRPNLSTVESDHNIQEIRMGA
jgi:hypothetical protein